MLERVLAAVRAAGALILLDVKRGDIGSTMAGYAGAYLDPASPLAADAMTASPYLGFGSLRPAARRRVRARARGVRAGADLQPGGAAVQRAVTPDGRTVAQTVLDQVAAANAAEGRPLGSVGVVVGATVGAHGHRLDHLRGPVLGPGPRRPGCGRRRPAGRLRAALPWVLPAASRQVLGAGPDPGRLRAAVDRIADEVRQNRASATTGTGR